MKTILVVDDDEGLVQSLTEILAAEGYNVLSAQNGEEGYLKAREAIPDLMLLDVMMAHDSEGFDIAKRLKQDQATCKIPVIMVTGIRKAKRLPFGYEPDDDWLPVKAVLEKPVPPDKLLKCIREVIG